ESSQGASNRLLWTEFGRGSPFRLTGRVFRSFLTSHSPLPAVFAAPNRNKAACLPDQKFALGDPRETASRDSRRRQHALSLQPKRSWQRRLSRSRARLDK